MVKLPDLGRDEIADAIYAAREARSRPAYTPLGVNVGSAGDECPRRIWYEVHWALPPKRFDGRKIRIFERGDMEEARVVADLRAIGCVVRETDEDGKQFKIRLADGWVRGRCDGIIESGLPTAPKSRHVLEVKAVNDKSHKHIVNSGLVLGEPKHHAQCQLAMHALKIKRALYVSVNKNDERIYTERVRYDRHLSETLAGRSYDLARSNVLPLRPYRNANRWPCSFCDYRKVCWEGADSVPSCRTCRSGEMNKPDELSCKITGDIRAVDAQRAGCGLWRKKLLFGIAGSKSKDGMPF